MKTLQKPFKALLGINAASVCTLFKKGPRAFVRACLTAFYAALRTETDCLKEIPVVSLGDILGNREPSVTLTIKPVDEGILPLDQALALLAILLAEKPAEVLEIGTFMGHTTRLMAESLPESIIHTVDLPLKISNQSESTIPKDDFHLIESRVVGRDFKGLPCEKRIRQHFADTATWDFQETGKPTFFFVDGSHTYEYCKNDSEKCLALCNGPGVFLWHDCDDQHPGVVKFIHEWMKKGRKIVRISGTPLAYWKLTNF
jgi:hypothetical protein